MTRSTIRVSDVHVIFVLDIRFGSGYFIISHHLLTSPFSRLLFASHHGRPALLQEFKGCTSSNEATPSIKARWPLGQQRSNGALSNNRTTTTKALDFVAGGGGFYLYARGGAERSTLVQVGIREDSESGPSPVADEVKLSHAVVDMAKIDDHHVVASLGKTLDIWKKSDSPEAFMQMQVVRGCWRETTPMHLIVPRKEDSACLVATGEGVQCLQLDGQCQKLRSFLETDVVTSVQWHRNERYVFSGTVDEGRLSFYDVRVSLPVSSHFVQAGLFDHCHVGNHTVLCAGVGGIIHIVDSRKLGGEKPFPNDSPCLSLLFANQLFRSFLSNLAGPPVHSVVDPFLQVCTELSCSNDGDLLAMGENGFTLWKVGGRSGLQYRGLMQAHGLSRGAFAEPPRGPRRAFTTDGAGNFREWDIQRATSERTRASAVPEFSEPVRASTKLKNDTGNGKAQTAPSEPGPELSSSEWDLDLDFNGPEASRSQNQEALSTTGPVEEISSLPMRDLDDLIVFYLS